MNEKIESENKELINENNERYELKYDKNGRLIKEAGFDDRVRHYGYDAAGRLVSHTDGDNRITQFKRDALGQLLKKWSSDQDISRYEYDPLGRLVHATNHHAELEFKFSDNGQLIEERQNNVRLRHEYDLNNQRSATLINNQRIDYEYNGQGLFKRIAYNGATGGVPAPAQFADAGNRQDHRGDKQFFCIRSHGTLDPATCH